LGRPEAATEAFARARVAYRAIDHHILLTADAKLALDSVHIPYCTTRLTERRRLQAAIEAALARLGGAQEHRSSSPLAVAAGRIDGPAGPEISAIAVAEEGGSRLDPAGSVARITT
jgi:hypothetical protein